MPSPPKTYLSRQAQKIMATRAANEAKKAAEDGLERAPELALDSSVDTMDHLPDVPDEIVPDPAPIVPRKPIQVSGADPKGDLAGGRTLRFLSPVRNVSDPTSPYDWGYSPRWEFDGPEGVQVVVGRPEMNLNMALAKTMYKLEGYVNFGEMPDHRM